MIKKTLFLVLGNQLFDTQKLASVEEAKSSIFFLREDIELCTYYKFHKHKIIFFLAAMRTFKAELTAAGYECHYQELGTNPQLSYEEAFIDFIQKNNFKKVLFYEIEDKFFEQRIISAIQNLNLEFEVLRSPMFLTSRPEFKSYLGDSKKPFMKTFYEKQRKKLNILIEKNGDPVGGKWSFDEENRLALPSKVLPPDVPLVSPNAIVKEVQSLTDKHFASHPGESRQFWLPVDRNGARVWLHDFLENRFQNFGPYEDAIPAHSDFVFHSVLTPFLNVGLLTPDEVVSETLSYAKRSKINIASVEGFIRQVIGWREFIRGVYQNYSEVQESKNFFNHKRKLTKDWYEGTTGIAPLDNTIRKTQRLAYAHHIERLMIVGSLMLLLEVDPKEAHRWFMEMFIDSSDWVMGPNVYGMALFSDGGIFATKPYFCGSNYYRKMGGYKESEAWCDGVDGLYWGFIERNKDFFLKNHRMSMMVRTVEKMDPLKKKRIYEAAQKLKAKITGV